MPTVRPSRTSVKSNLGDRSRALNERPAHNRGAVGEGRRWSPGLRSVHAPLQQHAIVLGIVQIKFFSRGKFP
jgi:hypothetical protein